MKSVRCSNCDTVLNLPPNFAGGAIQCPNCKKRFRAKATGETTTEASAKPVVSSTKKRSRVAGSADLATADELFNDDIVQQITADDPASDSSPERLYRVTDDGGVVDNDEPAAISSSQTKSPEIGDLANVSFGFRSFWTPAIIKGSWWCVVLLSAVWFLLLVIVYVGAWLSGESATSSLSGLLPQGLDLQQVLSGQADPDSLNKMVDQLGSGRSAPQLSTFQKVTGLLFGLLSFVSLLASLILSVLWCRVFFETIIAVFDIAARLKSIDEKTGHPNPKP